MRHFKTFLIAILALFFLNGCNIYRQMVIPTPYYPNAQSQGGVVDSNQIKQEVKQTTETIKQAPINVVNKSVVQRIPFPEDEYKSLATSGEATVKGSIYVIHNGVKVIGKQTRLYLNPVTSYSTQWYEESYLGGAKMSKVDPRLFNYLKFTTSDINGNFEFLNVPSGSYYLIGVVKCGQECGYNKVKSIRIAKKISVFGNEVKEVDLSKEF
jgi:hypothetical protein